MQNISLITIIMPVYNCEQYLKETINSIKEQTYTNWELIIVDDCSTDSSVKVIEENIQDIKSKVTFIKLKENKGVANARNTALNMASNKYIAYIDADDLWEKDKLSKQVEFMEENNLCFTYTSFYYLNNNCLEKAKKVRYIPKSLTYKKALGNTAILTSTVMINIEKVPRKLLEMPNIRKGQDSATWWQILKSGYVATCLNERLTYYRKRKQSLSRNRASALKRTWNLYRNVEKMSITKSIYYFVLYTVRAILRRIL